MVSSQRINECFTSLTIPQIDELGNYPPVNPDVGGIAIVFSSIIVNITLPVLVCWSEEDIRTIILVLITQTFPILIATIASGINQANSTLTIYVAHLAVAVTASPLSVYFAYSSFRDLIGRPNTLFRKLKTSKQTFRALGLVFPLLWLSVSLMTFFHHGFLDSHACEGITFAYWLEFLLLSNFTGIGDVLGRRALSEDQKHRGGLGTILVTMWIGSIYLVRHRYDIYEEVKSMNQKVRDERWGHGRLMKFWLHAYNVPAAVWHVITKSHPWIVYVIVICFQWSWVLGITQKMVFKNYQFSYGQITSLLPSFHPMISVGMLLVSRRVDFKDFLLGLPRAFVGELKFLAKGVSNPWGRHKVEEILNNPLPVPPQLIIELCPACQLLVDPPQAKSPPGWLHQAYRLLMVTPQYTIPPNKVCDHDRSQLISDGPAELKVSAELTLCAKCQPLNLDLGIPPQSVHRLCQSCRLKVEFAQSQMPEEPARALLMWVISTSLEVLWIWACQEDQPLKEIKTTQILFVAEGALKHVGDSERKDAIRAAFLDLQILESQYAVLAGFNEALIQSGFEFLEEIHVFCFVEIPISNPSSLLSKLGKVFTPYPGIIFTPSSGYKTPVFKEDKTIWNYDDLSSQRAESHSDIHIKGILQSGLNAFTSHSGIQPSISDHSGRGKDNRGGAGEDEGDHSDNHNDDYERRSEPEDDPSDPDAGGVDSSTPAISFQVQANLFKDKSTSPSKPFQMFRINGTLAIQTFPARPGSRQLSRSHVEFRKLNFQGSEKPAYEQFYVGVKIKTNHERTTITASKPQKTRASSWKMEETRGKKTTKGGNLGLSAGLNPTATIAGNRSSEKSSGTVSTKYFSRITVWESLNGIVWGFCVDDVYERQNGIEFGDHPSLPSVDFKFFGHPLDVGPPPPAPKHFDLVLTSCWSLLSPDTEGTPRWFSFFKGLTDSGTAASKVPSFSNLCQLALLEVPSVLTQDTLYTSKSDVSLVQSRSKTVIEGQGIIPAILLSDDPDSTKFENLIHGSSPLFQRSSDDCSLGSLHNLNSNFFLLPDDYLTSSLAPSVKEPTMATQPTAAQQVEISGSSDSSEGYLSKTGHNSQEESNTSQSVSDSNTSASIVDPPRKVG